jgi:hypothetical protein
MVRRLPRRLHGVDARLRISPFQLTVGFRTTRAACEGHAFRIEFNDRSKVERSCRKADERRLCEELRYRVRPVSDSLLTAADAARRLGISVTTLYDWLGQSDCGILVLRGKSVTIGYFQGGARGQGRIRVESREVDRILELMRVQPRPIAMRRQPIRRDAFPGITVPLGNPNERR